MYTVYIYIFIHLFIRYFFVHLQRYNYHQGRQGLLPETIGASWAPDDPKDHQSSGQPHVLGRPTGVRKAQMSGG